MPKKVFMEAEDPPEGLVKVAMHRKVYNALSWLEKVKRNVHASIVYYWQRLKLLQAFCKLLS